MDKIIHTPTPQRVTRDFMAGTYRVLIFAYFAKHEMLRTRDFRDYVHDISNGAIVATERNTLFALRKLEKCGFIFFERRLRIQYNEYCYFLTDKGKQEIEISKNAFFEFVSLMKIIMKLKSDIPKYQNTF